MKKTILLILLSALGINIQAQHFTVIDTLPTGAYGTAAWGDFNNDGFKDLAYLSQVLPNAACIIYENQNNIFTPVTQHFPYLYNPAVKWADLDNDGFDDLIMCGLDSLFVEQTFIYRSLGNGTFVPQIHSIPGLSIGSIDVADYNNDGWKDIAICGYGISPGPEAYIFKNNGSFSFTDIAAPLKGLMGGELKWQDYDGDGLPDLSTNGFGQNTARVRFYRNLGADVFMEETFSFQGSGGTIDWFDYNLDGINDFFITGVDSTSANNITALYQNDGNRNFTRIPVNIPDFGEPSAVAIADFNNDSIMDICLIGGNDTFFSFSAIAYGQGTSTFIVQSFHPSIIDNLFVDAADIDSDGDIDLVLSTDILLNDGSGTGFENFFSQREEILMYPNPGNEKLFIISESALELYQLFDLTGALIHEKNFSLGQNFISLEGIGSGTYMISLKHRDGRISSRLHTVMTK